MIGRWPWYEVILFAAGALSVVTSLLIYPWRRYRELWNEPPEHPAFFATRALVMSGVGLIAIASLLASLRDGQQDAALMSAGLLGLSVGMLLASWSHVRVIRRLLKEKS